MQGDSTAVDLFGEPVKPTHKTCTKCGREKPVSRFPNRRHGRFGLGAWCKPCHWAYEKTLHVRGRAAARFRKKHYGISPEEYAAMVAAQQGLCAICGKPETRIHYRTKGPTDLALDHDHETGLIRKLLCTACNVGLGNFKDDPALLKSALAYLAAHGRS